VLEPFSKQSNPAAATLTGLAVIPADAFFLVAKLTVTNRSASPTSFRWSRAIAGAADSVEQYEAYDLPIAGNDVYRVSLVAAPSDEIRVYATLATLSFNLEGLLARPEPT
jgi:hypothetical protein